MAERKAREDRVITDIRDQAKTTSERKGAAKSKRIIAVILWILAIGCEVAAIILFKKLVVLWPCLLALIVDAILCIIAAQFWKKANHIDPPAGKFWQNQFGAFMAVIAFAPFILILLTSKDVDPKYKKILTPEQYAKWEEMEAKEAVERELRMKEQRGHRQNRDTR